VASLSAWTEVGDWVALLKPRVMALVVFTGLVGLLVAPGHLNLFLAATSVLCIAMGAGAAGAINMWYDRDIDALMRRTARRPVPGGRISAEAALAFGVVLAPQNIVIGGAAGAFPPLIGWAAVTGSVGTLPLLLFAIVFCWTPPHFWALSLFAQEDYRRAGVPMLPVVAGLKATRRQIFLYTLLLVPLSLLPWALGLTSAVYGGAALLLGLGFVWHALSVLRDSADASGKSLSGDAPAKALFRFSIYYLFLLFAAIAVDRFFG
jgi:protoheme IX farnesyltransferase